MLIARTVSEVRTALRPDRRAERRIGLVPTMGALHDGHRSLLRAAREADDTVVISLFVNPTQFDRASDLAGYPRDEALDLRLARDAGVDVAFAPSPDAIYPPGFATTISVAGPAEGLEGEHRGPAHFQGVATVVCKLLNIVGPTVAYFGAKDAQQVAVVRRMVADLDIPTEIDVRPTVRESDGLAMSSRNGRLTAADRARAGVLHRALRTVREQVAAGERDPAHATAEGLALLTGAGAQVDYLELVDPRTMTPYAALPAGDTALVVVAAQLGGVRLIDGLHVSVPIVDHPVATPSRAPTT